MMQSANTPICFWFLRILPSDSLAFTPCNSYNLESHVAKQTSGNVLSIFSARKRLKAGGIELNAYQVLNSEGLGHEAV